MLFNNDSADMDDQARQGEHCGQHWEKAEAKAMLQAKVAEEAGLEQRGCPAAPPQSALTAAKQDMRRKTVQSSGGIRNRGPVSAAGKLVT